MPQYTLQDLERLAGQGSSTETYRDVSSLDTSRPPSPTPAPRDVRIAIYNAVAAAGQPISLRAICDALQVKKAPWIRAHVEDLIREGHLRRIEGTYKTGALMYFYELAQDRQKTD